MDDSDEFGGGGAEYDGFFMEVEVLNCEGASFYNRKDTSVGISFN